MSDDQKLPLGDMIFRAVSDPGAVVPRERPGGRTERIDDWRTRAVWAVLVQRVEGARGSGLCDCYGIDGAPTNPKTGAAMDHHCECRSVVTAATLLGAYSKTVHAQQCGHGAAMDEFYQARSGVTTSNSSGGEA